MASQLTKKREVCRVYDRGSGVRRMRSQPPTASSKAVRFWSMEVLRYVGVSEAAMASDRTCMAIIGR